MKDRIKQVGKLALQGILWVFVLSINWHGRPVFYQANAVLVQNSVVQSIDTGLADVWHRLERAAAVAFAKTTPDDARAL